MKNKEQYDIVFCMVVRASCGLDSVQDYLDKNKTDPGYIRNSYILISYYTELLLKSYIVLIKDYENEDDINNQLKTYGHNLLKINDIDFSSIGINQILPMKYGYIIKTNYGDVHIKNFIDIRYDFVKNRKRTIIPSNEHEIISGEIDVLHKIKTNIKKELIEFRKKDKDIL